jgi:hypothetical protein
MKAKTDSDIIDALGGTGAVADLCDVRPASVSEWRKAGIPKARRMYLKAIRPEVFGPAPGVAPDFRPQGQAA